MYFEPKISLKTIGCQPKTGAKIVACTVAHVYGSARNYVIGSSTYGEYTKFRGDFEAVNLSSGESYRSGNLLLPDVAADLLASALHAAGAKHGRAKSPGIDGDDGEDALAPIEFAVEIGIRPKTSDKPGGMPYEWTVRPLIEARDSDPLVSMRDKVKALSAPVDDAKNTVPAQNKPSKPHR